MKKYSQYYNIFHICMVYKKIFPEKYCRLHVKMSDMRCSGQLPYFLNLQSLIPMSVRWDVYQATINLAKISTRSRALIKQQLIWLWFTRGIVLSNWDTCTLSIKNVVHTTYFSIFSFFLASFLIANTHTTKRTWQLRKLFSVLYINCHEDLFINTEITSNMNTWKLRSLIQIWILIQFRVWLIKQN